MIENSDKLRRLSDEVYKHIAPRLIERQLTLNQCSDDVPNLEVSYGQNWPLYDQANRREKLMFLRIFEEPGKFILKKVAILQAQTLYYMISTMRNSSLKQKHRPA